MSPEMLSVCKELFRRGDISWFLHPAQKQLCEWLDARYREMAVICISRQFGKTTMLLAYAVAHCLSHPRSSVLFVAPHRIQAENYLNAKMNLVFSFLPDDMIPTQRSQKWFFPNGSVFRVEGVSVGHGARVRGDTVDLCLMDEVRDMSQLEEMIESHISPMLATRDGRIVMISTPPTSALHALTHKYIAEAIASNDFYTATYKQNPLISTKRLRYLTEVLHKGGEKNPTFRREYMADYTVSDSTKRVVSEWSEVENTAFFETYTGPPTGCRIYSSLDYAFSDPAGVLVAYLDYVAGVMIIEDEFFQRGCNTDQIAAEIIRMEAALTSRLNDPMEAIRICDIDPSLMSDMWARHQLRFEPARKSSSTLGMLNTLRIAFLEGRIRVRPTCRNLIFQLSSGVFNDTGTKYLRTQAGGHLDLLDSAKYLALNARWDELGRPTPERVLRPNEVFLGSPHVGGGNFSQRVISRPG